MPRRSVSEWLALLTVCLSAGFSGEIQACPVCMSLPTKTAADSILENESVVFAREHPHTPFTYQSITTLKGDPVEGKIDLFVDSHTRRRLRANPKDVVVLVRERNDKAWKSLGIADEDYQHVIRRILACADEWKGEEGRIKRGEYFLSLFGHENRAIFELAYLELGRAPYSMIKRVARSVSREKLRALLRKREYIEWRALAILLLARSGNEQDHRYIRKSFHDAQRFSLSTNLAAWATAVIELDRASALDTIEKTYLRDPNRSEAEIRAVITALSVHGRGGHVHLRDKIARSYGTALNVHPQVAGAIASDLTDWGKWDYREEMKKIYAQSDLKFERWEVTAIKNYIKDSGH